MNDKVEDYRPNSHKSKEEAASLPEKKIEKVVTGVKTKKKSGVSKLADVFISEDVANVKSYILMDVLVPSIKKAIADIVTNGIDMLLYGGTQSSGRRVGVDRVSYDRFSDKRDRGVSRGVSRTRFDYEDLVFNNRGEVEAVREQMEDVIERYGFVTVADMYDMADLTAPYTASKYGWTSIRNAEPVRTRDGYILKLPRAVPID